MSDVVVTLGVFDGVHRGHRHIFEKVVARARRRHGLSLVYTFEPHPACLLAPLSAPPMLNNLAQKRELIAEAGIDRIVVERFTRSFSAITPDRFFHRILVRRLRAREIFVGHDFTFGVHRSGTTDDLRTMGKEAGVQVHVVPAYLWKETLVSSTQIRHFVAQGQLRAAEDLLGRPYFIEGRVIRGRGIGGKKLGIHTANIAPENDSILPTGVYATTTVVGGKRYSSVTNIGPNPTFGPGPLSIETHILKFNRSIFRRRIRIEFLEKLREEITFASAEELARQIHHDIDLAQKVFAGRRDHRHHR